MERKYKQRMDNSRSQGDGKEGKSSESKSKTLRTDRILSHKGSGSDSHSSAENDKKGHNFERNNPNKRNGEREGIQRFMSTEMAEAPYDLRRQAKELQSKYENRQFEGQIVVITDDRSAKKSFSLADKILSKLKETVGINGQNGQQKLPEYSFYPQVYDSPNRAAVYKRGEKKALGTTVAKGERGGEISIEDKGFYVGGAVKGEILGTGAGIGLESSIGNGAVGSRGELNGQLLEVMKGRGSLEGSIGKKGMHGRGELEGRLEMKGKEVLKGEGSLDGEIKWKEGMHGRAELKGQVGEYMKGEGSLDGSIRWKEGTHGRAELKGQVGEYMKGEGSLDGSIRWKEGTHGQAELKAEVLGKTAGKGVLEGELSWKDGLRVGGAMKGEFLGVGGGMGGDITFYDKHEKAFSVRGVAVLKAGDKKMGVAGELSIGKEGVRGSVVVKLGNKRWEWRFGKDRYKSTPDKLDSAKSSEKKDNLEAGHDFEASGPGKQKDSGPDKRNKQQGLSTLEKLLKLGDKSSTDKKSQGVYEYIEEKSTKVVESTVTELGDKKHGK